MGAGDSIHSRLCRQYNERILAVERTGAIPIIQEDGLSGISLSRKLLDDNNQEVNMEDFPDMKELKSELYLFDARIR